MPAVAVESIAQSPIAPNPSISISRSFSPFPRLKIIFSPYFQERLFNILAPLNHQYSARLQIIEKAGGIRIVPKSYAVHVKMVYSGKRPAYSFTSAR